MLKQSFKLSTVNSGGRNAAMSFVMDAQPLRFNSFTVEGNALRAESGRLMQPVRSVKQELANSWISIKLLTNASQCWRKLREFCQLDTISQIN